MMKQNINNAIAELSPALVAAVRNLAIADGESYCAFLTRNKLPQMEPEARLEVAAALKVIKWRNAGLIELLKSGDEIMAELSSFLTKAESDDATWNSNDGGPLVKRVFQHSMSNFALAAQKDLGGECLMQTAENVSDEEVAAIAKMLWQLKHSDSRN